MKQAHGFVLKSRNKKVARYNTKTKEQIQSKKNKPSTQVSGSITGSAQVEFLNSTTVKSVLEDISDTNSEYVNIVN